MNHNQFFSIILFLLISSSILFLSNCKINSTSSTNNTLLKSVTIGTDGGVLETAEFHLQIPTGSFQKETTLSLHISNDALGFDANGVSQSFRVEGLPDEFDKPLRLAIKYNDGLSDSSYISYGSISEDFLVNDTLLTYQFLPSKDSSGFLVGKLNSRRKLNVSKRIWKNLDFDLVGEIFQAVSKFDEVESPSENFLITYPKSLYNYDMVENFAQLFDEINTELISQLGFKLNLRDASYCDSRRTPECCWIWPLYINIKSMNHEYMKMGMGINKAKDPKVRYGPYFQVDGSLMGSSYILTAKAQIASYLANLRILTEKYEDNFKDWKWLGFATHGWLQGHFSDNTIAPYEFTGNELAPFNGLQFGSALDKHGHGLSSMLKYLIDNEILALNKIGDIFNTIHEQKIHPVTALLNNVNALVADWWPDFFEKLIDGKIYDIDGSVFLNSNQIYGIWSIDDEDDNIKVFSASDEGIVPYTDLSAKMFMVNLNYSGIDESARLYLESYRSGAANNDGVATLVFSVNNNNLQHLITAKNSATVLPRKLKEYYNDGIRQFLVVVVNSSHNGTDYLGITDIDLKIEVKKEAPVPDFNRCGLTIKSGAKYDYVTPDNAYSTENDGNVNSTWEAYPGTFSGNTFTASYYRNWDSQTNPLTITGSITATFNEDYSTITNIVWNQTHVAGTSASPNGIGTKSIDLNATDIPFDPNEYFPVYQVKMEQTCDHINSYTDTQTAPQGLGWTMPDYWCNGDSKISISFSKE